MSTTPPIAGISHVDLTVSDLERAAGWYTNLLNLTKLLEAENTEERFRVQYLFEPRSRLILGLVEHQEKSNGRFDPRAAGLDHVALACANRDELRAWRERLDELGIENSGVTEQGVGAGLNYSDPDGIALEFYVVDVELPA